MTNTGGHDGHPDHTLPVGLTGGAEPGTRAAPTGRLRRWRAPFGIFALLLVTFTTWTIGMPLFTSPDEAAHLYKAYGTAHFEALGEALPDQSTNIRLFDVPAQMGTPDLRCYFGFPSLPADCAVGSAGVTVSTASVYPPFWYAVVGGAARAVGQDTHQRVYRFTSAMLCALLIALAFESARRSRAATLSPLLLIGLTPMAVFLAGTLNPNAFEVAGFMLAWSLCLHLGHPRAATVRGGLIAGGLVAALLLSRFASVVWVAAGALAVAALSGIAGIRQLGRRFFVPALGCAVAAVAALVAWSAYSNVNVKDSRTASDWSRGRVVRHTLSTLPDLSEQMIGVLGWLDTPLPVIVHWLFAAFTVVVLAGVALCRDGRVIAAAAVVVAALVIVPVGINVISAPTAGLIWQGRYSLPMYAAFGVIGMLAWQRVLDRTDDRRVIASALRYGACGVFAVAEVVAFWQALRRYTVGVGGTGGTGGANDPVWLSGSLPWQPDVAPMLLLAINAAAVTGLCAVILRSTATERLHAPR